MATNKRLTDQDRARIRAALESGMSQNRVAKETGWSPSTINRIAKETGLTYSAPKKAIAAHRRYAKAGRVSIIEAGLAKAEVLLQEITVAKDLQPWSMAVAVLIDKRRQEDESDSKRHGTIRQYLELEFNRPGADEPQTEDEHPAGG